MSKTKSIVHAITILITLTLASGVGLGAPTDNCTVAFFQSVVGPDVTITSAQIKTTYDPPRPASPVSLPDHCKVEGWRCPMMVLS